MEVEEARHTSKPSGRQGGTYRSRHKSERIRETNNLLRAKLPCVNIGHNPSSKCRRTAHLLGHTNTSCGITRRERSAMTYGPNHIERVKSVSRVRLKVQVEVAGA